MAWSPLSCFLPVILYAGFDEELIAYLLGDATPQLRKRVETGLADDESLRARLTELRLLLGQLDSLQHTYDPPVDLLASTMARIDAEAAQQSVEGDSREQSSGSKVQLSSSFSAAAEAPVRRSTWDSMALVVCLAILYCLFLPTVLKARYESRKAQCAHNLHGAGRGLSECALLDPQRRFPAVAVEGPNSFAGIYAVSLSDRGMIKSASQLQCASFEGVRPRAQLQTIPTMAQLRSMDEAALRLCKRQLGATMRTTWVLWKTSRLLLPSMKVEAISHCLLIWHLRVRVATRLLLMMAAV